jgi:hypothetical protein
VLLIGQSLELRRAPLAAAVAARHAAPLRACARRQLAAGTHALDLNAGRGDPHSLDALRWSVAMLREAGITAPLWLDCGDMAVLAALLREAPVGPLVANAVMIDDAHGQQTDALLAACARSGAGAVFSPRVADAANSIDALLAAQARARDLLRMHALAATCYFDCLAYPPAHDHARTLRSLAWLRALHAGGDDTLLLPLVAVGNVAFGVAPPLRAALRRAYAASAVGAGARALIAPVEDARLHDAVAVAAGERVPRDDTERWWHALARAACAGAPLPPPAAGADALTHRVSALLPGDPPAH